jgi:ubiquinone/menaquinone biosynthesis C-methylase UbiE
MPARTWDGPNDEAIEAWNGVLFDKFVRFKPLMTGGLGMHGTRALARHLPATAQRVLDVGMGFGDSSLEIARALGTAAEVVGVDAAQRFVEAAGQDTERAGLENLRFFRADVQTDALEGPYDFAFSRFGTMFFANPVQALRNIGQALRDGSTFCFVVWRKREDNAFLHLAESIAREIIPEEAQIHDQPTCGPGPFSMASADLVSDLLLRAGFGAITFERSDGLIGVGASLDEAVEFALALGPAGEILRLAGDVGVRLEPKMRRALRSAFEAYVGPEGVRMNSSTWIVTAMRNASAG